jgi:hypothetical protein
MQATYAIEKILNGLFWIKDLSLLLFENEYLSIIKMLDIC